MAQLKFDYFKEPRYKNDYKLYTVTIERKEITTVLARNDEEALNIAKLNPDTIEYTSELVDPIPTCSWHK